ncbi:hypothetical protein HG537_0A02250 [Torulaspora globosa]|uniref:R3H domain-containing protein n=1 Tax=Torulaspora globosa TaxID=48254 RepID=A0A7H9HJB1_9SACH|nr:hypothetical protein HG537_0A02250 [Torulaspora sp. CBS 2947]
MVSTVSGGLSGHSLVLEFSEDDSDFSGVSGSVSDGVMEDDDMAYYERAVLEIARGDKYVCMICTVEMDYTCKMYACEGCYRVFDFDCIREWALKSTRKTAERIWKCPNCYRVNSKVPASGRPTCWCGKVVNPEPNPLNPNSCGQTCDAPICSHGCSKQCHLGPHPQCDRTSTIRCRCGKHRKEAFCYDLRSMKGKYRFQCREICGLPLACGIHTCQRLCHSGLCGPCPAKLYSKDEEHRIRCYCGLESKDFIECKNVKIARELSKNKAGESWIGAFSCNRKRKLEYRCHKHSFVQECVPSPSISCTLPCPYSPELLKTCPCGRTPLKDLGNPRKSCTSPIPNCDSICGKKLACGKHACPYRCHDGPCMDPCTQVDVRRCACHQRLFSVSCQFQGEPRCNIKCESLMSCRRHRCTERCCSGRPEAERRRKIAYSSRELLDESLVESQHICLKECNLTLSCGIHKCQMKCHPGKCPPCLESDSNDMMCPCGKTVVEAPVRCGTKLPPCRYPCIRVVEGVSSCGHKPMPHTCHPLTEPCPPCTAPVFKPCKCGKKTKVRTLCFQNDVSCGITCNKRLENCPHLCQKSCHLPGECQKSCKQICNRQRIHCQHKCPLPCHGNSECPDLPCNVVVPVTCECGFTESFLTCGANSEAVNGQATAVLPCSEECEIHKRHLQLKEAFGISDSSDPASRARTESCENLALTATTFEELELPYSEQALGTFARQQTWCTQIEETLIKFMNDAEKSSLHFKPMRPAQRLFVRNLAKSYNLYSESQDPEPKRSVFIKKLDNGSSIIPKIRLADSLLIYQSFKQMENDKKAQRMESQTTTRLINFPSVAETKLKSAENNAFMLTNLSADTAEDDLVRLFAEHLKPTLVKNPQFKVSKSKKTAYIYPEDYADISTNVERDLEALVGHFDYICKESFIGDGVELCHIDATTLEDPAE